MIHSAMGLRSALLLTTALWSLPALAQPVEPADEADDQDIVITGTRIAGANIQAFSPVQVVDDAQIRDSGVVNIQELLLENPAFGTPTLSRTNSAFLTSGTGSATVDLRDLGSDRTLVLINGRRVVAGLAGSATVDLNVIPAQFLRRVDILTGGASSLYGSDAVAGVVNFIYKDDFEGIEVGGQYGITQEGDDAQYQINATLGHNFEDGRGNIMVHLGYSNQRGVLSRQRSNTAVDDLSLFALTGDPADFTTVVEPFFSGFAPQGRFVLGNGQTFTYSPTGQLQPCFTANGPTCVDPVTGGTGVGPNGFNREAYRTIAVPVERYLFAATGRYEVTDGIRAFFEGTYNSTRSSRLIEPFAAASANPNGIFPVGQVMPLETFVNGTRYRVAFVPDAIFNAATDQDGDGLRDVGFARRLTEFGPRTNDTTRDFYRFVVGLEGDLFDDRFHWDVSYNYGRSSENQQTSGQVNVPNFREALNAIVDIDDLDRDGNRTEVICANATARAEGCRPLNIFGLNAVDPAAVAYVQAQGSFQTRISQQVWTANLSGALFDLPAGSLGVAVGLEYRREASSADFDALTNAGQNAGNALPDTAGSFNVREAYGEINIPILADRPFFHQLSLRGAGRISDYSTVGTVYSYSLGAEWAPLRDVRFTGTYARAVRAPNVGELFTAASQTFPAGLQDPCIGIGLTGGGALGDNCRAAPGVLANIQTNGVFTLNQADLQGVSGFNSGNPDLVEETADSWTASMVITPTSFLRSLVVRIDYFKIDIDGAIVGVPRQFSLDQCYRLNNPEFCALITRRPTPTPINSAGSLSFINQPVFNGGALSSEGVDVAVNYRTSLDGLGLPGAISARLAYTHLFDGSVIPVPGADPDPFVGEVGTADDRFTASLAWSTDNYSISFTGTYIGESNGEDDQTLAGLDLPPDAIVIPAEFYLDMQVRFPVGEHFGFYVGVDNLLDNDAPQILSGTTFNTTGTDTAADVYDPLGRRFYAGATLRF